MNEYEHNNVSIYNINLPNLEVVHNIKVEYNLDGNSLNREMTRSYRSYDKDDDYNY